jgi:hypothetical protein
MAQEFVSCRERLVTLRLRTGVLLCSDLFFTLQDMGTQEIVGFQDKATVGDGAYECIWLGSFWVVCRISFAFLGPKVVGHFIVVP